MFYKKILDIMNDDPKSKPQGKRYLFKKPCAECNSKGFLASVGQEGCAKCKCVGWIVDKQQGEILCPSCKGYRTIDVEQKRKCVKCQGIGYSIHIMQNFVQDKSCQECESNGEIVCGNCRGDGGGKCHKCSGSGMIRDGSACAYCDHYPDEPGKSYKLYNVRWWVNQGDFGASMTNRCKAIDLLNYHELGQPMPIENIQIARTRFCEKCSKEVLSQLCDSCGRSTKPRIRHYDKITCRHCKGRSNRMEPCPECHRSGVHECSSCNSTGKAVCGKCQGSGQIIEIFSTEV